MTKPAPKSVVVGFAVSAASAASKLAAAVSTGSSAMLVSAVHSLADMSSQGLLLFGLRPRASPASREIDAAAVRRDDAADVAFWGHVVAMLVFAAGAGVAIHDGAAALRDPRPVAEPHIAFAILALVVLFVAASLWRAVGALAPADGGATPPSMQRGRSDTAEMIVVVEHSAALTGAIVTAGAIAASHVLGWSWADGAAAIVLGLLMASVAAFMALELRQILVRGTRQCESVAAGASGGQQVTAAGALGEPPTETGETQAGVAGTPLQAGTTGDVTATAQPASPPPVTTGGPVAKSGRNKHKKRRR